MVDSMVWVAVEYDQILCQADSLQDITRFVIGLLEYRGTLTDAIRVTSIKIKLIPEGSLADELQSSNT